MNRIFRLGLALVTLGLSGLRAQEIRIAVQANQVLHKVSRYLTGACIEDVNHEIYGGIDSQMIFGESFAEPVPSPPLQGFAVYGGRWLPKNGELQAPAGDGPKLISEIPAFGDGEVSVDVNFPESKSGNAGLIVKVAQPGIGADNFTGYEVALETAGRLVLGRHRHNWEPIRNVPCEVPIKEWLKLTVRMTGKALEVLVNGRSVLRCEDTEHPLDMGTVGLRTWQRAALFRDLQVTTGSRSRQLEFALTASASWADGVSGMWRAFRHGTADGKFAVEEQDAFSGRRSQRIEFTGGRGEIGIENQSLNRWGMHFTQGKSYEGFIYVRSEKPAEVFVALESRDGARVYAQKQLDVSSDDWQRLNFSLKPNTADSCGRFAIELKKPGAVSVGYALLQPGKWGRFKSLPVRKDVADALRAQGITVLRLGGSMVNAAEYRWKKMIGPREKRPPYAGTWYPYSSNGWGIFDFLNFCEAAGFLGIPDLNMGETPEDMGDFIAYVNSPKNSEWGRRRASDGHPEPYHLKYLELGNEEKVNEEYASRFELLAKAIWANDPGIILIVGDFAYSQSIQDPFNFHGAASGITTLAAQQRILQLAKKRNREVWFDVHVGTDGPRPDSSLVGALSFRDALDSIADGAKHQVAVFEFNAGNHSQRRAVANALAIQAVERDGRIPISTSANCLQPDGQNDNDWDQGLLFLNPLKVWLQPPGYVTQMFSRNYLPLAIQCRVSGPPHTLEAAAQRSADGGSLTLQVVNPTDKPIDARLTLSGFVPKKSVAQVTELSGPLSACNTAEQPNTIIPRQCLLKLGGATAAYSFSPYSVTVLRLE